MKVVLFGANGMVGGGVLRECFENPQVDSILAVERRACGMVHPKLRELILSDLFSLEDVRSDLTWVHPAVEGRLIQDEGGPSDVHCLGTIFPHPEPSVPESGNDDGEDRSSDDPSSRHWVLQSRAGGPGHQRTGVFCLTPEMEK